MFCRIWTATVLWDPAGFLGLRRGGETMVWKSGDVVVVCDRQWWGKECGGRGGVVVGL